MSIFYIINRKLETWITVLFYAQQVNSFVIRWASDLLGKPFDYTCNTVWTESSDPVQTVNKQRWDVELKVLQCNCKAFAKESVWDSLVPYPLTNGSEKCNFKWTQ